MLFLQVILEQVCSNWDILHFYQPELLSYDKTVHILIMFITYRHYITNVMQCIMVNFDIQYSII
jgi:hypothetical protein